MIPTLLRGHQPTRKNQQFPMLSLFDEMNRFFGEAFPVSSVRTLSGFSPTIDVKETGNEFILTAEFPGMEAADVNIELKDNILTLSGEKKYEHEQKEGERVYVERTYGSFSRSIPFSVEVDEDNATAEMKKGVLSIKVPKSAKAVRGAKKLTIKSS